MQHSHFREFLVDELKTSKKTQRTLIGTIPTKIRLMVFFLLAMSANRCARIRTVMRILERATLPLRNQKCQTIK